MGGSEVAPVAAPSAGAPERPFAELRVAVRGELELDPQLAFSQESWRLVRLLHLPVVELAEPPEVSDDGRSYLFRLRPGTGARPSDVAAALERLRELDSPGEHWFEGVQVRADDESLTVEYHLAEPDAAFLTKLATPLAAPRLPTGPYVLADGPVFRRNPRNPTGNATAIRVVEEGWDVGPAAGPPGVAYVFLNTQLEPFDSLALRRAVGFALDRRALAVAAGGRPSENLLPPSLPGYEQHALYRRSLARARRLVRQAGAEGAEVVVWSTTEQPARLLVETLDEIGLEARLRAVPTADFYRLAAGRTAQAQVGVATWSSPLPHPVVWFDALVHGDRIGEAPNTNLSYADDPELNGRIALLRRQPLLSDATEAAWAELDRLAVGRALVLPFAVLDEATGLSRRLDRACVVEHVVYGIDLARLCVGS